MYYQPGGSMRDEETIAAADEAGITNGVHGYASLPSLKFESLTKSPKSPL